MLWFVWHVLEATDPALSTYHLLIHCNVYVRDVVRQTTHNTAVRTGRTFCSLSYSGSVRALADMLSEQWKYQTICVKRTSCITTYTKAFPDKSATPIAFCSPQIDIISGLVLHLLSEFYIFWQDGYRDPRHIRRCVLPRPRGIINFFKD